MEEQIKIFLNISDGSGYGSGYGAGSVYGAGSGAVYGDVAGDGSGTGSGDGYGTGYGAGYGYGYGAGSDDGDGSGSGDDSGVKMFNGDKVYMIDGMPTIVKSIRSNVAKGFILNNDFTLEETFIVKGCNKFAHGKTLHEAFQSLQEKLYDDSTEEERLEAFKKVFTDFSVSYPAKDLFYWHHILTGSCRQGRLIFCKQRDIDLESDMFTVYEFINLTRDSYGGEIIRKLEND